MRILLRLLLGFAVLLAVAVAALALLLPRLLASEAVRSRIQAAAESAVGREVHYGELEFGLLPPSLLVLDVSIAGVSADSPRLAEVERVALRLALLPLLARAVVVESLTLQQPTVHLVRTKDGFLLPERGSSGATPSSDSQPSPSGEEGTPVDIALAGLELRGGTIVVEDRSVSPPVTWQLRDVGLSAHGASLHRPVDFDLALGLASGGRISAVGNLTLAGAVDVKAELDGVDVSPLQAYLGGGADLAGTLSGTVVATGPAANPARLQLDGVLHDGRLRLDDALLTGPMKVAAEVRQPLSAPTGHFDIDATAAGIRYGDILAKQPGDAATASGKIVGGSDGSIGLDDVVLRIRNFEATGEARLGKRLRIVVSAPPFDLDGWGEVIPVLSDYRPSGPVRLENLAVTTSPLDVRGAVFLDGVTAVLPERGPVRLEGAIRGAGDGFDTQNLRIVAADQVIAVDGSARELGGDVRYRVDLNTEGADANRLVSTFSNKRDFLYGLLTFDGKLRGTAAGARPPLEAMEGRVRIDIDRGRLKGVSLLQLTFDRLGSLGSLATLASQLFGGPDLSRFYADDFREISGNFDIAGGLVRTDDLRIVYRDYTVDLRGRLRMRDLGIDMTGRITMGEDIERALGSGGGSSGAANTIPLARVTGTLDQPKVHVTEEVAAAFLSRTTASPKLQRTIDDAVGKEVGDLLEGILGGGTRQRRQ